MKGFFIGVLMRAFCALFAQHGGSKIILRHPVTNPDKKAFHSVSRARGFFLPAATFLTL
jgi:hypothetical protein